MQNDKIKEQEILYGNWDYLIILDACRYDYFEKTYNKYLKGTLEKRISRGSCTAEWLDRTFTKKMDDVVYISANPFVNGKNAPLNKTTKDFFSKWNPTKYFKEIVDVWLYSWDDILGTVHPKDVNKSVRDNIKKGRMIIHYVQPHEPYLTCKHPKNKRSSREKAQNKSKFKSILYNIIKLPIHPIWNRFSFEKRIKIKKMLWFKLSVIEKFYSSGKIEELKNYYQENLEIVLNNVANLIKDLNGKIVITADHGEAFGEEGDWGHKYKSENPVLREVPWFVINKKIKSIDKITRTLKI